MPMPSMALPDMDADMRPLAEQTIHKLHNMTDAAFEEAQFTSNRQSRQRLDRHGTIVVGSCETFHHYNVQGVK